MKARLGVLVIVVVGLGLAVGGWWLITSPRVANTYLGTQARRYLYFSPLTQKIGMNWEKLPFAIEVMQEIKSEGGSVFAYTMLGKFERVDLNNPILYLITKDGKRYGFRFALDSEGELMYRDRNEDGSVDTKLFAINPFDEGVVVAVQWTDKRSLEQIILEAQSDPKLLVNPYLDTEDYVSVSRIRRY